MHEVETFLSKIWKGVGTRNSYASWIKDQVKINEHQEQQKWIDITEHEVVFTIMKYSKWKARENDGMANFWLKSLNSIHEESNTAYNNILKHPETAPDWLTDGLTYLLHREKETKNPKSYHPITCLPTLYRILTSILTKRSYAFLEENELLPTEQKDVREEGTGIETSC